VTAFLWDENTSHHLLRAIRRRRPDLDIVTVQQLGLAGAPDEMVVERALTGGRVVVTHDRGTILSVLATRLGTNAPVPGVVVVQLAKASVGTLAEDLIFLADAARPDDWQWPVFIP
jgi:hypothetical protein